MLVKCWLLLMKNTNAIFSMRVLQVKASVKTWKTILLKILEKIQIIGKSRNKIVGHDISGSTPLSLNELTDAINLPKSKVSNGSKLGTFGKNTSSSGAKRF